MTSDPVPERPVLYLKQTWLFTWEQHAGGGCRCLCRFYHQETGTCTAAAEPGLLLRVVSPDNPHRAPEITDPLPLCASCYTAITPLAEPPTSG
uniref:Uncharacterized protein n=1 Tax=Streptomyces tenjimariensis TaxID=29308 RepID=Q2UZA3_9ACTN|nr:hypothetical protein [Streptomyces tenjimariensis]